MNKNLEIRQMSEEAVVQYLHEVNRPDWSMLKTHPDFTEKWPSLFLDRTRPIPREAVLDIYNDRSLNKSYRINLSILRCKETPVYLALNLIPTFRWLDLLNSLRRPWLTGPIRSGIEGRLMEITAKMALGEKIALARQAPRSMIRHLRTMPERPVIRVLLTNPAFTFEDAMFVSHYPKIPPGALEELALCTRWRTFVEIRKAILTHPRTPRYTIYPLAASLSPFDLRQLLKNTTIPAFTRMALSRILVERTKKH